MAGLEITLLRLSENNLIEAAYFLEFAREFVQETDELAKLLVSLWCVYLSTNKREKPSIK